MQRLPVELDAHQILQELRGLEFVDHFVPAFADAGNSALRLVTTNGEENDEFCDPMLPTAALKAMPYTLSIWNTLGAPLLRSRFMRIAPGGQSLEHVDTGAWWQDKFRIHIPVKTNPFAIFTSGGVSVHMAAGSCWLLNTKDYIHSAANNGDDDRIHLVIDVPDTFNLEN